MLVLHEVTSSNKDLEQCEYVVSTIDVVMRVRCVGPNACDCIGPRRGPLGLAMYMWMC